MKKSRKKVLSLLSLAAAAVILIASQAGSTVSLAADVNDSNVQSLESQISQLQTQQAELLNTINALENEEKSTQAYKEQMDYLATVTATKMYLAQDLISELDTKIEDTEGKLAAAESNIEETRAKCIERLRYSQENGRVTDLELLLDSKGLSDFLTRLDKVAAMMDYDRALMKSYTAEKENLESYKETLEASKSAQNAAVAQLESDKATYEQVSADNAAYLQAIEQDKSAYEAEYYRVKEAEDALNAELQAYIIKAQEQSQVVYTGEGFVRPIAWGTGYVSSPFGWRDLYGIQDYHRGTDIACAEGTPIIASSGGKVIRAEWHWSYGNYVLIDHGNNISTLYAHCCALAVGAGAYVEQGQTIGYVGQTGNAYGAHVHFEYRINGGITDPEYYVQLR